MISITLVTLFIRRVVSLSDGEADDHSYHTIVRHTTHLSCRVASLSDGEAEDHPCHTLITLVNLTSHLFTSQMGRQKITLAKAFLDFQLNLLLVDVDVVILRNVMHYFAK